MEFVFGIQLRWGKHDMGDVAVSVSSRVWNGAKRFSRFKYYGMSLNF